MKLAKGQLHHGVSLAPFTSWRIGGEAQALYWPTDSADLINFLKNHKAQDAISFLGLGSNVLVGDGGIKGLTVITQGALNQLEMIDTHKVRVGAGVSCAKAARFAARNHCGGGGFLAGIPGTIGGALAMNAGAFGGEIWPIVSQVQLLSREGELKTVSKDAFSYSYRSLKGLAEGWWFYSADLCLVPGDPKEGLESIKHLLAKRAQTQPTNEPSCGSVFRNPDGDFAARLIESVGLKGHRINQVQISPKHANFMVNLGGARAQDVKEMIDLAQEKVEQVHAVSLKREVIYIGED